MADVRYRRNSDGEHATLPCSPVSRGLGADVSEPDAGSVLERILEAKRQLDEARLIVACHPDDAPAIQAAVDAHRLPVDVRPSRLLADSGTMYVMKSPPRVPPVELVEELFADARAVAAREREAAEMLERVRRLFPPPKQDPRDFVRITGI